MYLTVVGACLPPEKGYNFSEFFHASLWWHNEGLPVESTVNSRQSSALHLHTCSPKTAAYP